MTQDEILRLNEVTNIETLIETLSEKAELDFHLKGESS